MKANLTEFSLLNDLPEIYSTRVSGGDCLFIPSGTWYMAQSQGIMNIDVQFLFKNIESLEEVKVEECDDMKSIPLKEVCINFHFDDFRLS